MGKIVRRVAKVPGGYPGVPIMQKQWARISKPMRRIRSVRTLIKVQQSDGRTTPEFKNTLQRAGVGTRAKAKTISRQRPNTPKTLKAGALTRIKPPRPAGKGGIKDPYKET
jgi:hypothetical protein